MARALGEMMTAKNDAIWQAISDLHGQVQILDTSIQALPKLAQVHELANVITQLKTHLDYMPSNDTCAAMNLSIHELSQKFDSFWDGVERRFTTIEHRQDEQEAAIKILHDESLIHMGMGKLAAVLFAIVSAGGVVTLALQAIWNRISAGP